MKESDVLQAFGAHPKIGDIHSLSKNFSHLSRVAANEQSSMQSAASSVLTRLALLNAEYEKQFGFIFIICAAGKSPEEMLHALEQRLPNSREKEIGLAQEEQLKIALLRLEVLT
jgi:OHCU decarboxylase